ncbi:uncharacterized protein LOC116245887 isoform X2 [Nymphaea colorata]|uniref:uncharacterized protein LOC116245887 isoform X2 n=1 Tax=Nymphaea colorata TaxID=210225 RepID=UPI00129E2730|nr:uncharacterized protein LOC116245887 isoform X2 [Nymphaea colorata]
MAAVLSFGPAAVGGPVRHRTNSSRRSPTRLAADLRETPSASVKTEDEERLGEGTAVSPPPGFKPPQPKRFSARPDKIVDVLSASLALPFRLGTGAFALGYSASFVSEEEIPPSLKLKETSKLGPRPEMPIEIYEFESCPFCRKVREIVSVLDLDVLYYPCPRNGPTYRPKVIQMGGKSQFPYMVDPNTGVAMYESDDIINYLVGKYGDGTRPFMLSLGLLTTLTAGFAMIGRMGKGSSYTPSKAPPKPLELWAYEASPFCKIVREVMVELELPHLLHSTARGSPNRQKLFERAGHFQAPYLEDPNTGVKMFESAEIIDYLKTTYMLPAS